MTELYIARKSLIHSTSFFFKCLIVSIFVIAVHIVKSAVFSGSALLIALLLYVIAKLPFSALWRCLRIMLLPVFVITMYLIFTKQYYLAVESPLRIIGFVLLANLVSLTSSLSEILKESEKKFFFLRYVSLSPKIPGVLVGIFLRTIPLLYLEKSEMEIAATLRGAYKKGKRKKIFSYKMIFSLLLRAVTQTDDLSLALHMRGFSVIP